MRMAKTKDKTTLISSGYVALNEQLHVSSEAYGTTGQRYAKPIMNVVKVLGAETILDYGAGKGTLKRALIGHNVFEYDPTVPKLSDLPKPADLLVCTDVLEHVEPNYLKNVLNHMRSLSLMGVFITISTNPSLKFLSDGRNAHISLHPEKWWRNNVGKLCNELLWEEGVEGGVGSGDYLFVGRV
jgi:2-polyprenyl-3-methyl-5-hydroxy-6-metoxy-1,4-benzoquinol methylase